MFNVGGPEVLVILLVALIALGPGQLPDAARKVGQVMNEIRKVSTNFQRELTSAFEMEEEKAKPNQKEKAEAKAAREKAKSPGGPTDVSAPVDDDPTPEEADEPSDDTP